MRLPYLFTHSSCRRFCNLHTNDQDIYYSISMRVSLHGSAMTLAMISITTARTIAVSFTNRISVKYNVNNFHCFPLFVIDANAVP